MARGGGGFATMLGLGPPQQGARPAPSTRIAPWRYLVLALVAGLGILYAAPNLFPPDFALQVTVDNSERDVDADFLAELERLLTDAGIGVKGVEMTPAGAGLIRVADSDGQLRGSALLGDHLNPVGQARRFVVALNLASTTPAWLSRIGGVPMTLGLDLRGGAHFVLQVDMEEALGKRLGDEAEKIRDMLRAERIRYRRGADSVQGDTIRLGFANEDARDRAVGIVEEDFRMPDFLLAEAQVDGRPGITVTVQDSKKREIEANAVEQNLTGLRNRINELGVAEPLVQKLGGSRIVIDLPGVQDSAEAKRKLDKFANLEFRLEAAAGERPSELEAWTYEGRTVQLNKRVILTGDRVIHAAQSRDQQSGLPVVNIRLDSQGGELFHDATAPNIGRRMAVIFIEYKPIVSVEEVDGERVERQRSRAEKRVISLATIRDALGYNFQISGLTVWE